MHPPFFLSPTIFLFLRRTPIAGKLTLESCVATSLPTIKIPFNSWVDLYSESGIQTGTQIVVQNLGDAPADLSESSLEPLDTDGSNVIFEAEYLTNKASAVGAWAFSKKGTVLQVEIA